MGELTARIQELLASGRTAGRVEGEEGPAGGAPPELRREDPGFGDAVTRLLGMPLDEYARAGAPMEIRVPWCAETLWFVPVDTDADRLGKEGVGRGRIWTAAELDQVMAMPGLTPAIVETLGRAKLAVGGDIVEVRPLGAEGVADMPAGDR
jgi:hypothetical protein